jgi:RimJ/RimL family protein N-acetyltransferase
MRIEPWSENDLPLLERVVGDPAMMEYLGGPESAEKIAERQARYEKPDSKQFRIVDEPSGHGVGWVGYWEREWRGMQVYEIGWSVIPGYQGRGLATSATAKAVELAGAEGRHRFVHAFPAVENGPSNAICRKLGFTLLGEHDFEFPPGHPMLCNDWRLELFSEGERSGAT